MCYSGKMMIKYIIISLLTISTTWAEPIRVAVLDTGLDFNDVRFKSRLCKDGHFNATSEPIKDLHGHGTHVIGLIIKYARNADYCLQIVKGFSMSGDTNVYLRALYKTRNADIVNISMNGKIYMVEEDVIIKNNKHITFVVAAGNERISLEEFKRYPASYPYDNVITVGSKKGLSIFSNYGRIVDVWENGEHVLSTVPGGEEVMSGSSMSSAIKTGKLIYETYFKRN
jgi:subtilisin family serine protease